MKAFPVTKFNSHRVGHDGMDLRDYFAAAALQGLLTNSVRLISGSDAVTKAYEYADAMLEQRQR